jgi:diguanylate cyclase (GGDEF)-like protein
VTKNAPIRVLLIEDSPTQALQTLAVVADAGAEGAHAETLEGGLATLRGLDFDLILLDLNLPDSQGSDTVERACRVACRTPVIVLTAQDDDQQVDRALELGAQDFLVKGRFDADALRRSFRYAIHRKRAEADLIRIQEELRIRIDELEDNRERLEHQGANLVAMAEDLALARDLALQANRELEKRIRETDCLYTVSRILDEPGLPLGEALQRAVAVMPRGWKYTEIAAARLVCPGACRAGAVTTANFRDAQTALRAELVVRGDTVGFIEVVYLEARPGLAGDPFLSSERKLIEELGRRLSQALERSRMQEELRRAASTDPLTGASNRRHFLEAGERELQRSRRYGHPLSVLMLDIDHFKRVNDRHGHAAGDEVLKAFVVSVQKMLREMDVLGRLGGEEFAIILPETALAEAILVAERLREAINRTAVPLSDGGTLKVTSSIGVSQCVGASEGLEECLTRADEALYRAKENGRDQVMAAS